MGCFIFLILINFLGYNQSMKIGEHVAKPMRKRMSMGVNYSKYIDDLTIAVAVNLKQCLKNDENGPKPTTYHARTQHVLAREHNVMQDEVNNLKTYAKQHEMVINDDKTKVILFNNKKSLDFQPQIRLESEECLEVVEEIKLLGIVIRSDLSWSSNTDNMCKKAFARMWMIRRLKALGAENEELLDIYRQQIVSVLELAAPVWTPGLTQHQVHQIERVQKTVIRIIQGDQFISYKHGLKTLKLTTLKERRQKLNIKFTKNALKQVKCQAWFTPNITNTKNT